MSFWGELKRRNVVKVGIAYTIVAWLIIHPIDIIFPILHLPEWTITFVTSLLIIGFPFVLIFAWAFEITPEGIKLTKDVPLSKSITKLTGKKLNYILAGLLVIAVAYIIFNRYYLEPRAVETKQAALVGNITKTQKTIAVLPFVDLSPNSDQEYFVNGLSEELLDCITQISNLRVTARTSSFSFKGSNKTVQEIAGVLGVENILEGSVRKAGNALRITAQLVRAVDGFHLWSKTYDRELKDIFAVQKDIATAVANELKATLGIGSLKQLGGTQNEAAYELYLTSKGQRSDLKIDRALGSIDAALLLDPKFALAYALKSNIHNALINELPDSRIAAEMDEGMKSAQKAIELEPDLAEAHFALGMTKTVKGNWIDAESAYQKALELTTDPSSRYELAFPVHYMCIGYFERAKKILEEQIRNDPLNRVFHLQYIEVLYSHLGDRQGAEEENKLAKELFKDDWKGDLIMFSLRLSRGEIVPKNELPNEASAEFNAMGVDLASPEKSLAVYRKLYTDMGDKLPIMGLVGISLFAAYFGDPEFTMDLIEKAGIQRVDAVSNLWCPVMHEVRQTPRFKQFVKKIGLVDYWNKFGWPDMCHQLDNGDFECD
jgi:TolB-like protein